MMMTRIVSFDKCVPKLYHPCDDADDIMDGIGECKSRMCVCARPLLKHIKQTDGFSQQCKLGITHSHTLTAQQNNCETAYLLRIEEYSLTCGANVKI